MTQLFSMQTGRDRNKVNPSFLHAFPCVSEEGYARAE